MVISFFLIRISGEYSSNKSRELNEILRQVDNTLRETNEIERKSMLTKTYITTWNTTITDKQKEKNGIDIESIKQLITEIANKYVINNLNVSLSIPTDVLYVGKKVISIINSEIEITFNCLTEYDVYFFLNDLYKNNDAFFVVESLEIRKNKNIDKNFIKELIDKGRSNSIFTVKIKIQWYEFSGN